MYQKVTEQHTGISIRTRKRDTFHPKPIIILVKVQSLLQGHAQGGCFDILTSSPHVGSEIVKCISH